MENEQRDESSAAATPDKENVSQQRLQNLSEEEAQQIESRIIRRIAQQVAADCNRREEMMHERVGSVISTRTRGRTGDSHERVGRTDSRGFSVSRHDKDPHDKDPHDKDPGNFDRNNFDRNNFDRN